MDVLASVYFVDVGQGTSQVILFRDSSVVIIDCGKSSVALCDLIESISFDRIRAVVLSHWHDDHVGGAPLVVQRYADRIDRLYIPQDRPANDVVRNKIFKRLNDLSSNRRRFEIELLVHHGPTYGRVWPLDDEPSQAQLRILYPDAVESLEAASQPDPNQGSGILILECDKKRMLFPGDAGKLAFEAVVNRISGGMPLECDIVAAPHHSGKLARGLETYPGYANCYEWLYSSVLSARFVTVSAGTDNTHNHPRESHLSAAIQKGAGIMCTQITPQCHVSPPLLMPVVLDPCLLPSSCLSGHGVGCAGTIQADIGSSNVNIHRLADHQNAIDTKLDSTKAMCRRLKSSPVV